MKKIVSLVMLALFLAACSENLTPEQQEYKDYCKSEQGDWHKMNEMREGTVVGEPCYGCMRDHSNHYCSMDEFKAAA